MTTEGNLVPIVRDINVLLHESTYQGMSDAEIQAIIDYKVQCAITDTLNHSVDSFIQETQAFLLEAVRQREQEAASVLKSTLKVQIPWVRVGGDS